MLYYVRKSVWLAARGSVIAVEPVPGLRVPDDLRGDLGRADGFPQSFHVLDGDALIAVPE